MKADAFTRVELLVSIATVGLLSFVGVSVTADTRERSEQIVCMNNLRQVGRAFHAWAAEHGGENPWWVRQSQGGTLPDGGTSIPYYVVPSVGTFPASIVNNAWFHFLWAHEDLPSPSVLVCPSDALKKRANNFSTGPGGLAHISMQNNAVSYLIGAHAVRESPWQVLSADRDMSMESGTTSCSSAIRIVRLIRSQASGGRGTAWTNGLHAASGNVLMNDGAAEQMTSRELNAHLNYPFDDIVSHHFLVP
jgi:hypothetical protein